VADRPVLDFARLLRQLRAEAALTQEELAAAAGVSARSVSDLERGVNRTARKDTAELLAGALGLAEPVRELFVAAARGRAPAASVLAAMEKGEAGVASSPGSAVSRGRMWSGCPYLGLVPFQERDAQVFYGRGELVAQLAQRLDGLGIMTGPAAEAGLAVELTLTEAVIAELREGAENGVGSGVLPLMSQALAATWEHREGNELTLRAYRRDVVIDSFSARRLLVLGTDSVEISHDVLLYVWKQFRDWLGDDQIDRVLYSQVVTDARMWDINRRDSSYLYQPGRLATIDAAAIRWQGAPTRYPPLPATGKAFLRAAHRAASRRARQRRGVIAGLVALTLIAVSAAGIAVRDAANGSQQRVIALSQQLAVDSLFIASSDPLTARRLAVAAWRVYPSESALSIMTKFLTEQQQDGILPGDEANGGVKALAFSPDGQRLASASGDGTVRLWDPATGQAVGGSIQADTGPGGGVNGVAFSPDGKLLATAGGDGTVKTWQISLFTDPYTALCADVGAPTTADWAQYAAGEPQPSVCSG
jgi:transcriptional regulator with XRE-family HTH domain